MTYKEKFQELLETEYRVLQSPSNNDYLILIRRKRIIEPFFCRLLFGKFNNNMTDDMRYKWVKLSYNSVSIDYTRMMIARHIEHRLDNNINNWNDIPLNISDFNNYY